MDAQRDSSYLWRFVMDNTGPAFPGAARNVFVIFYIRFRFSRAPWPCGFIRQFWWINSEEWGIESPRQLLSFARERIHHKRERCKRIWNEKRKKARPQTPVTRERAQNRGLDPKLVRGNKRLDSKDVSWSKENKSEVLMASLNVSKAAGWGEMERTLIYKCVYDVAGYHCKSCKCVMSNKGLQKPLIYKKKFWFNKILFSIQ